MDVLLDEDEQLLRDSMRRFFEAECPTTRIREIEEAGSSHDPELWKKLAELGWLGMALPEEYGGAPAPFTHLGLLFEEAGRGLAPVPLHAHTVAALTVAAAGSDAQRAAILPGAISGDLILTWAWEEQHPGIDAAAIQLRAQREGDNWRLSGSKRFVEGLEVADRCLLACRTGSGSDGDGISLLLVDLNSKGISVQLDATMGGDQHGEVTFQGVVVPGDQMLGEAHSAWPIARAMFERAVVLNTALMVGATRKAVERAVDYAKERVVFDQPIGAFQAIQHMCANMITWVDGAELLMHEALWKLAVGEPASTEIAAAKAFANERCQAALREANQIHAGIAQIKEFDQQLWYRRAAAWSMRQGTSIEHRRTVARAIGVARG